MVKRIIGILLSFCMTAVFVSGCGENAENPDTADNSGRGTSRVQWSDGHGHNTYFMLVGFDTIEA